jgi:CubicO group peptidase (beta-lactamase class C family)
MPETPSAPLPPLPRQRADVPWPTERWPEGPPDADVDASRIDRVLEQLFLPEDPEVFGQTHGLVAVHRGRLVAERYGPEQGRDTPLVSWSMAKSVTHALVGVLVREGRLDPDAPAPVPAWRGDGDPRAAITTEHLLRMVDGLDFLEDYVDAERSSVIDMLFGSGKADVAGYAERSGPAHPPGRYWNYSSGTSNIVAGIVGRVVGGGEGGMLDFMRRELFLRIGMRSAAPRFDAAGTFIGSSFVFATTRDFARFGLLYLRDGVWEGERLLPAGWVDHARRLTPASFDQYGAHWWLARDGSGIFHASGYRGQYIAVDPRRDLVVVRLGNSDDAQRAALLRALAALVAAFPLRDAAAGG